MTDTIELNGKNFVVDEVGFLKNFNDWSEDFAKGIAKHCKIEDELTEKHWQIIFYIRRVCEEYGACPIFYKTCKDNNITLKEMKTLFPSGYQRGACRLAGVDYTKAFHSSISPPRLTDDVMDVVGGMAHRATNGISKEKHYLMDVNGFLIHPDEWDEHFCGMRARDMKMPDLSPRHWDVISFIRKSYFKQGFIPTVYDTCEANNLDINEFSRLFPDGYHRGAVKIAGLRLPV